MTDRFLQDLGWGGWAIIAGVLAVILVPTVRSVFFASDIMHSIESQEINTAHEFKVRDAKMDFVYTKLLNADIATKDDVAVLSNRIETIREEVRHHQELSGPLIQKLEILWARAAVEHEGRKK